ncbi:MAG: GMC family oxidoreductase N-terminal domain-containing protein [Planctomycetota bacterium]
MIYGFEHLQTGPHDLEADLCVVGTGAGGGPVVRAAVEAGLSVVALEAGGFVRPRDMTQLEHEMLPKLYHEGAARATRDKAIHVHQGKGVGGSTLHNINLCKRTPEVILGQWRAKYGLSGLGATVWDALYEKVESELSVSSLTHKELNGNNRVLKQGCEALGYAGGYLQHNRQGCMASGFCEVGCPFDAKENALKVYMGPAVRAGATVLTDTWALKIRRNGTRATAVEAITRNPANGAPGKRVTVHAQAVCSSAGATGTPTLLQRSEVPDPPRLVGSRIHLHPGAAVAGVFEEQLASWIGIPQSWECTEFLDLAEGSEKQVWIIAAFAHPAGVSSILSGFGREHARYMNRYRHLAALSPMIHDHTSGTVRARGDFGVEIEYDLTKRDQAQLMLGVRECARILLAAGAQRAVIPFARMLEITDPEHIEPLLRSDRIKKHDLDLTAVHPMSSCWMGDDPATSCVDSYGRYHHLDNLFVADTSLFPTSTGAPPQLTAYALGKHVGRTITRFLGA